MTSIYRRELRSYFTGMTGIVFAAFLLLVSGIFTTAYVFRGGYSNYSVVLNAVSFVYLIIVPILTMRSVADDRMRKTDQLLYSLPMKISSIICGKYLAMVTVLALPMAFMALIPLIMSIYGTVNLAAAYSALFAFFLLGCALIAVGMFFSSLTESPVIAAVLTIIALIVFYLAAGIASLIPTTAVASFLCVSGVIVIAALICYSMTKNSTLSYIIFFVCEIAALIIYMIDKTLFEGLFPNIVNQLAVFDKMYSFFDGIFDLTGVIYYLSVIFLFVFFSAKSMEQRRWA